MKKLMYLIVLALILSLVLTGCLLSNVGQVPATEQSGITYLTKGGPAVATLFAGKDEAVGTVTVSDDGTDLTVIYETNSGWEMTETHLYVGKTNPTELTSAPGQFPYSEEYDPAVSISTYTIQISEIDSYHLGKGKKWVAEGIFGVEPGGQIYIAAHAEVEKITEFAPRYPSGVFDSQQGFIKDGITPVKPERSVPEHGLEYETGKVESNFFSLGFGGLIIVEFDCPIPNGEGDDLRIIEDTWSKTYPLETAEVFASQDGIAWVSLGTADNAPSDGTNSFSTFDLLSLGWAKYIKVVDTTDPNVHRSNADGFDLNAVEALQDCIQEETAWGDGEPIRPDKNWAMYFNYTIPQCWSLIGEWKYTAKLGSSTFSHDMTINDDLFSGTGAYPSGGSYTIFWTVSGGIVGNNVDMTISYISSSYWAHLIGTINDDGTMMSGDWTDSNGKAGTWESTEGVATPIYCN